MKANDIIKCPHCGETAPVKIKREIIDWKPAGEILICGFCNGKVGVPEKTDDSSGASPAANASDRLSALLGGEKLTGTPTLDGGEGYREFCRHCRHFLWHPFVCRCDLTREETDPGSCCEHFELKTDDTGAKA